MSSVCSRLLQHSAALSARSSPRWTAGQSRAFFAPWKSLSPSLRSRWICLRSCWRSLTPASSPISLRATIVAMASSMRSPAVWWGFGGGGWLHPGGAGPVWGASWLLLAPPATSLGPASWGGCSAHKACCACKCASPLVSSRTLRMHLLALAAAAARLSCSPWLLYLLVLLGAPPCMRQVVSAGAAAACLLFSCLLCCQSSVRSLSSGFMGFGWSVLSSLGQLVSLSSPAAAWWGVCGLAAAACRTWTGGAFAFAGGCCCVLGSGWVA